MYQSSYSRNYSSPHGQADEHYVSQSRRHQDQPLSHGDVEEFRETRTPTTLTPSTQRNPPPTYQDVENLHHGEPERRSADCYETEHLYGRPPMQPRLRSGGNSELDVAGIQRYRHNSESLESRSVSPDASLIQAIVFSGVGLLFTGGLSTVSAAVALASLRLATATFYGAAVGGATVGTGYVVVKGGQLVVQKARPGIFATIRAANHAAREARAMARTITEETVETAGVIGTRAAEGAGATVQAGMAASGIVLNRASHVGDRLVRLLPGYQDLLNPRLAGRGLIRTLPVRVAEAETQTVASSDSFEDTFIMRETEDGEIELRPLEISPNLVNPPAAVAANRDATFEVVPSPDPVSFLLTDEDEEDENDAWEIINIMEPPSAHLRP